MYKIVVIKFNLEVKNKNCFRQFIKTLSVTLKYIKMCKNFIIEQKILKIYSK